MDPMEKFRLDCPTYEFVPAFLPCKRRIIALGDIHGDLTVAIRMFRLANLINDNMDWIAVPADTVVVQVGDQIDSRRGNDPRSDVSEDVKVMEFFDAMHKKAKAKGGAVYSLLGNHELLNIQQDFRYVSSENMKNFRYSDNNTTYHGLSGRRECFNKGGPLAKHLACSRNTVIIIGDIIFVHGGILAELHNILPNEIDNVGKLEFLNEIIRKWILNSLGESKNNLIRLAEGLIENNIYSPFWARTLGQIDNNVSIDDPKCHQLKEALEIFKIGNMVVGHTPQGVGKAGLGINGTCYDKENGVGRLYRIDGGFSRAFEEFKVGDSSVEILEIINCKEFRIIRERDY